jgi:DNA-binding winged helix-turn-helix (wHTH) protein
MSQEGPNYKENGSNTDLVFEFGPYLINVEQRVLTHDADEIHLAPKTFDLLLFLVERSNRIVKKEEVFESVWNNSFVEDANLVVHVSTLRKIFSADPESRVSIETFPKTGYRLNAEVRELARRDPEPIPATPLIPDQTAASEISGTSKRRNRLNWPIAGLVGLVGGAAIVYAILTAFWKAEIPEPTSVPLYRQLTFERGTIWSARYGPRGGQVIYGATFNGEPLELHMLSSPSTESQALDLRNTSLLSVSSKGEKAILRNQQYLYQFLHRGTLARMSVGSRAIRELAENVQEADWDPAGEELAIVRWNPEGNYLEYPIGKRLAETRGYFSFPRVSPAGDAIALFEHPIRWDNRGQLTIMRTDGTKIVSSDEWGGLEGLAWSGDEVWFTASKEGESYSLYAMKLDGSVRTIERGPSNLMLHDIAPNGSALLGSAIQQTDVYFDSPATKGKELSWLHLIGIGDLSTDGQAFLFTHFGAGSGKNYSTYLRKTDGSPAIRLGEGRALSLSPDGQFAVVKMSKPLSLRILPAGSGSAVTLRTESLDRFETAKWFPKSNGKIILTGSEANRPMRTFSHDLSGEGPVPITPEGVVGVLLSPDEQRLIATDETGRRGVYSFESRVFKPINGLNDGERILRWNSAGSAVFVFNPLELPIRIYQLDPLSGSRSLVSEIVPHNTSGLMGDVYLFVTPDGKSAIYGLRRYLIDLYEVDGLRNAS